MSVDLRALHHQISLLLNREGKTLNDLSKELGYERREVSEFLFVGRPFHDMGTDEDKDFLCQDLITWVDGKAREVRMIVLPILTERDFRK
jgi:hypothetical protein